MTSPEMRRPRHGSGADARNYQPPEDYTEDADPIDVDFDIWGKVPRLIGAIRLSPLAFRTYIIYASHANRDRFAWPTQETVLKELGALGSRVHRRSLTKALGELLEARLLQKAGTHPGRDGWTRQYLVYPWGYPYGYLVYPSDVADTATTGVSSNGQPDVAYDATTAQEDTESVVANSAGPLSPIRHPVVANTTTRTDQEQTTVPVEQTKRESRFARVAEEQDEDGDHDPEQRRSEEEPAPDVWATALDRLLAYGVDPADATLALARGYVAHQEPWQVLRPSQVEAVRRMETAVHAEREEER
jgi:hypothetical protein